MRHLYKTFSLLTSLFYPELIRINISPQRNKYDLILVAFWCIKKFVKVLQKRHKTALSYFAMHLADLPVQTRIHFLLVETIYNIKVCWKINTVQYSYFAWVNCQNLRGTFNTHAWTVHTVPKISLSLNLYSNSTSNISDNVQ